MAKTFEKFEKFEWFARKKDEICQLCWQGEELCRYQLKPWNCWSSWKNVSHDSLLKHNVNRSEMKKFIKGFWEGEKGETN